MVICETNFKFNWCIQNVYRLKFELDWKKKYFILNRVKKKK